MPRLKATAPAKPVDLLSSWAGKHAFYH